MRPLHQRHKIRRVRTCAARPRSSEAAKRTMSVKRPEPNWFGPFVFGLCSRVAKWQGSTLLMCLSGVRIPLREPSLKVARSFNGEDSGLWNRISGFESLTRSQSFLDRRSTAGREPLELHIRVRIPAIQPCGGKTAASLKERHSLNAGSSPVLRSNLKKGSRR